MPERGRVAVGGIVHDAVPESVGVVDPVTEPVTDPVNERVGVTDAVALYVFVREEVGVGFHDGESLALEVGVTVVDTVRVRLGVTVVDVVLLKDTVRDADTVGDTVTLAVTVRVADTVADTVRVTDGESLAVTDAVTVRDTVRDGDGDADAESDAVTECDMDADSVGVGDTVAVGRAAWRRKPACVTTAALYRAELDTHRAAGSWSVQYTAPPAGAGSYTPNSSGSCPLKYAEVRSASVSAPVRRQPVAAPPPVHTAASGMAYAPPSRVAHSAVTALREEGRYAAAAGSSTCDGRQALYTFTNAQPKKGSVDGDAVADVVRVSVAVKDMVTLAVRDSVGAADAVAEYVCDGERVTVREVDSVTDAVAVAEYVLLWEGLGIAEPSTYAGTVAHVPPAATHTLRVVLVVANSEGDRNTPWPSIAWPEYM